MLPPEPACCSPTGGPAVAGLTPPGGPYGCPEVARKFLASVHFPANGDAGAVKQSVGKGAPLPGSRRHEREVDALD